MAGTCFSVFTRHRTSTRQSFISDFAPGPVLPPVSQFEIYATVLNPRYSLLSQYSVAYTHDDSDVTLFHIYAS